jgi:hypothetical protein
MKVQKYSIQFNSIQFNSIQFNRVLLPKTYTIKTKIMNTNLTLVMREYGNLTGLLVPSLKKIESMKYNVLQ